ncbi:MAG: cobalamin B12-binding domain-containing protein [Nitrospinae bacterium]|nr:cobalamin B12-binding domain-containing protein [Nitrospinota bacterium]
MKVSLIHYDVDRITNEPGNKTVMKHFGHMPNIQLLYVAGTLEKLEVELQYLDIIGMGLSNHDMEERLKAFQPDVVGLSVFTSHFHNVVNFVGYIKSFLPDTKVILGGVHTSIFPEETLIYNPLVDYACVGEAEMVMPEFVRRFTARESFEGLKGLVWRDESGAVRYNGPAPVNLDLDSTPFPARHLVPNEVYYNFISTRRNYTVFNSSRGCPFACIFCEAAQSKWRARSAMNIADEFEECYEKHGIREIDLFDSSFTIKKQRVLDICAELIRRGLHKKIIWDARSRVDSIDQEMLEAMKEAGCYRIFYGLESGNPEILLKLRKKADVPQMRDIVNKTKKVGISAFGYFLVGSPGETYESYRQTVDLAKSLPLDFAIFNALVPFPKTQLYENYYVNNVNYDFWADYIKSPKPIETFLGRPWTNLTDEEVRQMSHKAMLEFYFRPVQLMRAVKTVGSMDQFARYCRAGVDMLSSYAANFMGGGSKPHKAG